MNDRDVSPRRGARLARLDVPPALYRNADNVIAEGVEETGQQLIELAMRETGRTTLADAAVLDVGCGTRFTQTLINRGIPVGSYTGMDVSREVIAFLEEHVEARDDRFRYHHCDFRNAMYNPGGSVSLPAIERFPVGDGFDQIWLFSVFTHLEAADAAAMLRILRTHVASSGWMIFSAFTDPDLEGFEDRHPEPLVNAYYGRETMRTMIADAGWRVERFHEWDRRLPIVDYFVCAPVG